MNLQELRRNLSHRLWPMVIASSVFLAACGGGGGGSTQTAGIGGTGIVAGKVTGFGSIYVNGRKIETDQSQFIVDGDDTLGQDDLAVGMYVQLRVETLNGELGNEALEVFYDDEVQGPVAAAPVSSPDGKQKTFMVFGQTITIDDIDTLFKAAPSKPNFSFDTISADDVVEISGFRTSPNAVTATYVEFKELLDPGNSEVELRGTITGYTPGAPETFGIVTAPGITISANGSELREPLSLVLQNGLFVEVEGTYVNATSVLATEIEQEDEDYGDAVDDVSLQGVISNYDLITGEFEIDGLPIDTSAATELSPANVLDLLDNGVEIEVEGDIEGGILVADEVELREGDSKLRAFIDTVNAPDFTVHFPVASGPTSVTVRTDSQTLFEDETGASVTPPSFSIDDLTPGMVDFVRIEGTEIAGNVVLATTVKRIATVMSGDPSPEDKLELEGKVDNFNFSGGNGTITVLGIEYQLQSGTTSYAPPGNPPPIAADNFVEIEDQDEIGTRADGIADEVEKEL